MGLTARKLFEAGDLTEALQVQTEDVKGHPADVERRGFLAELLSISGDLDRADKQLEVLVKQSPDLTIALAAFRQLVRGDQARRQLFSEGRLPEFLEPPPDHLTLLLEALVVLRSGDGAEAQRLALAAEEKRPPSPGRHEDVPFDDFRDLDDMFGGVFEVLTTNGKYYWVPVSRVESLEFQPPERPRDLLWRGCRMIVRGGPDGVVYIPAIYVPPSPEAAADRFRLGRATEWTGGEDRPVRGLGQRMFLAGDQEVPIMGLTTISFDNAAPPPS